MAVTPPREGGTLTSALARLLYVYTNKHPNQPLDPMRAEFVKHVLSKQGQQAVIKDGYFPITAKIAEKDAKALGLAGLTH